MKVLSDRSLLASVEARAEGGFDLIVIIPVCKSNDSCPAIDRYCMMEVQRLELMS